jgi:predicted RNase H-related nuclease YkuK (DUF458 family)
MSTRPASGRPGVRISQAPLRETAKIGGWCRGSIPISKIGDKGSTPFLPVPATDLRKETAMMISPTLGKLSEEKVSEAMLRYYEKNKHFGSPFKITFGTDSQNFSDTKTVVVIAMCCVGHGGIYFYEIERVAKIRDVRRKLNYETGLSLTKANAVIGMLESDEKYSDMCSHADYAIHVDAGKSEDGKTRDLIPGIVGWIEACGFDAVVKPDSYTASSIADRISK